MKRHDPPSRRASPRCAVRAGRVWRRPIPTKPIRMIVPFAAGGPDRRDRARWSRRSSPKASASRSGREYPGAGGNIGARHGRARGAATATRSWWSSTGFIVNPSLYAKVPYDPIKDFAPITLVAASPNVLFVNPQVPAKTVQGADRR